MPAFYCSLAQSVEHAAVNRGVVSSSLTGAAKKERVELVPFSFNLDLAGAATKKSSVLCRLFSYVMLNFCYWKNFSNFFELVKQITSCKSFFFLLQYKKAKVRENTYEVRGVVTNMAGRLCTSC